MTKCCFELCNCHATGNLKVMDREALIEIDCCIDCWNKANGIKIMDEASAKNIFKKKRRRKK